MSDDNQDLKLFDERQIRTIWDEAQEKWYFSVVDVIEVLTDSSDVKQKIARATGIPTTRQGLERKIGGAVLKAVTGKKRR